MRRMIVAVVFIALAAGACGGDDNAAGEATTSLDVDMVEFAFEPAETAVPAGQEITLNLSNSGSVEHEFAILNPDVRIETEEEFEESMVYFEAEIEPGDAGTFTFTAPARGIYQVVCVIPGHFTAGMEARLQVVDG